MMDDDVRMSTMEGEMMKLRRVVESQERALRRMDSRRSLQRTASGAVDLSVKSTILDDDSDEEMPAPRRVMRPESSGSTRMATIRESFMSDHDLVEWTGDEQLYRLFSDVKDGIENPSIFLIQSLAVARNAWHIDALALLVFFFQAWFPTWFACVVLHRANFSMIAPGFHNRVTGSIRERWLHRFSIDLSSFCFLSYIAWSTWQQRQLHIFRFYLYGDGVRINRYILGFGMMTNVVAIFSVVFLTYLLFRIEPDIHEILLNAVALDFIHRFDQTVCATFLHHTKLHLLLRTAKSQLIDEADRIIHRGALGDIAALKDLDTLQLLGCRRLPDPTQILDITPRFTEVVLRYVRRAYVIISGFLLVFAFTGGHIAHTHIRQVFWYFGIGPQGKNPKEEKKKDGNNPFKSESSERLKFLVRNKAKDPDTKYAVVAIFATAIVLVIIFVTGSFCIHFWYGPQDDKLWFKEHIELSKLRRAASRNRRNRRSISGFFFSATTVTTPSSCDDSKHDSDAPRRRRINPPPMTSAVSFRLRPEDDVELGIDDSPSVVVPALADDDDDDADTSDPDAPDAVDPDPRGGPPRVDLRENPRRYQTASFRDFVARDHNPPFKWSSF